MSEYVDDMRAPSDGERERLVAWYDLDVRRAEDALRSANDDYEYAKTVNGGELRDRIRRGVLTVKLLRQPGALKEPSKKAVQAAIACRDYDDGPVRYGDVPTVSQTYSLVRNKLRAAYKVDFAAPKEGT